MITLNPDLKGIVIGKTEHKIVQFADDTTIILDGSLGNIWLHFWIKNELGQNKANMDRAQEKM